MIRCMAVLTISLLLTVSCSGGSDTETARVPASVPTALVASPTSAPTQVPPSPTPTQTPPPVTTPRPIPEGILAVSCEDKHTGGSLCVASVPDVLLDQEFKKMNSDGILKALFCVSCMAYIPATGGMRIRH